MQASFFKNYIWWIAGLAALVIAGPVIFSSCGNSEMTPPVIRTYEDYTNAMGDVVKLTQGPFNASEDHKLTPQEQHDLRVALVKMQGITGYKPVYNHFFIAGKICYLLGDLESAETFFDQCVEQTWPEGTSPDTYVQTVAETHYMLSKCFFLQDQFQRAADEAATAATHFPNSALYKFAEAQAEAQLQHTETAIGLLQDVLKIDPQNEKARNLLGFILLGEAQKQANLHHTQKALDLCKQLIAVDPKNPDVDKLVQSLQGR